MVKVVSQGYLGDVGMMDVGMMDEKDVGSWHYIPTRQSGMESRAQGGGCQNDVGGVGIGWCGDRLESVGSGIEGLG